MKYLVLLLLLGGCTNDYLSTPSDSTGRHTFYRKVCLQGVAYYESVNAQGNVLGSPVYRIEDGAAVIVRCSND